MTSASLADTTSAQTSAERSLEPIDVLGLLAEAALANLDGGTSGDRYQVVIHVSAEYVTTAVVRCLRDGDAPR